MASRSPHVITTHFSPPGRSQACSSWQSVLFSVRTVLTKHVMPICASWHRTDSYSVPEISSHSEWWSGCWWGTAHRKPPDCFCAHGHIGKQGTRFCFVGKLTMFSARNFIDLGWDWVYSLTIAQQCSQYNSALAVGQQISNHGRWGVGCQIVFR